MSHRPDQKDGSHVSDDGDGDNHGAEFDTLRSVGKVKEVNAVSIQRLQGENSLAYICVTMTSSGIIGTEQNEQPTAMRFNGRYTMVMTVKMNIYSLIRVPRFASSMETV